MTPGSVPEKVINIIAAQKRIPPERISADTTFEEIGLDSLDAVNILFELEGAFDISIPDEQARKIKSVRGMIEGVEALIAAKSA